MTSIEMALSLIINILFDLYIFVLFLRLFMQKLGVRWANPFSQFVITLTEPVIKPLRRFIPGFRGFDLAIVFVCIIFEIVELMLLIWLKFGILPGIFGLLIMGFGDLAMKVVNLFFYITIIAAIISWVPTLQNNPIAEIVNFLVKPLLRIAHRYIPLVGGFDLSPIAILIILWLINILIFQPIVMLGTRIAFT